MTDEDTRRGSARITDEQWDTFLAELALHGNVTVSTRKAGISDKKTVYRKRNEDVVFSEAWDEAIEASRDELRDEIDRRGRRGFQDEVASAGKVVVLYRYSDAVLLAAAKVRLPEYAPQAAVAPVTVIPADLLPDPPPSPDEPGPDSPIL